MKHVKPQKRSLKKPLLIIGGIALIAAVAVIGFLYWHSHHTPKPTYQKTSTGYPVNLNPPTQQDKTETNDNKKNVAQEQQNASGSSDASKNPTSPGSSTSTTISAKPFIVYAAQQGQTVETDGYTSGVFEDGGTCTATYTQGTQKVTGTSKGFKDADHTTCPPILLNRSAFPAAGTWSVTLSYSSATASGTSTARNVTIQ